MGRRAPAAARREGTATAAPMLRAEAEAVAGMLWTGRMRGWRTWRVGAMARGGARVERPLRAREDPRAAAKHDRDGAVHVRGGAARARTRRKLKGD